MLKFKPIINYYDCWYKKKYQTLMNANVIEIFYLLSNFWEGSFYKAKNLKSLHVAQVYVADM